MHIVSYIYDVLDKKYLTFSTGIILHVFSVKTQTSFHISNQTSLV